MRIKPFHILIAFFSLFSVGCSTSHNLSCKLPEHINNIIVITVDTLRADHLGTYGYPHPTSPVMDRFARNGSLFQRCVANIPKTGPSLASMITSTMPERHLVFSNEHIIEESLATLAEHLRSAGYFTGAIQSNNICRNECGFSKGFFQYIQPCRPGKYHQKSARCESINNVALPWLEKHVERSFFLWIHYLDPHGPYDPPDPFPGLFDPADYDIQPEKLEIADKNLAYGTIPQYQSVIGSDQTKDYVSRYDAEIRYWDTHFSDILRKLETLGLAENTAVFLTSDHGESLVEHEYYFEHGAFLYEQGLHIPLIVKLPGIETGRSIVAGQTSLLDIAPTILQLAGAAPLPEANGQDLMPWVMTRQSKPPYSKTLLRTSDPMHDQFNSIGITDGRWKFIRYGNPDIREDEFFNILEDPNETRNITSKKKWLVKRSFIKQLVAGTEKPDQALREPQFGKLMNNPVEIELLKSLGYVN